MTIIKFCMRRKPPSLLQICRIYNIVKIQQFFHKKNFSQIF